MKRLIQLLKNGLLLPVFFLLFLMTGNGQTCTINQPLSSSSTISSPLGGADTEKGQNFLACGTGVITAVSFEIGSITTVGNTVLTISTGSTTNGGGYTQTVNVATTGVLNIPLATPFPVIDGNQYAISLAEDGFPARFHMRFQRSDVIPNSAAFSNNGTISTAVDCAFSVTITAPVVATAPIPTMSQWGLLIFGLLIMNLSIFYVHRRELI